MSLLSAYLQPGISTLHFKMERLMNQHKSRLNVPFWCFVNNDVYHVTFYWHMHTHIKDPELTVIINTEFGTNVYLMIKLLNLTITDIKTLFTLSIKLKIQPIN